MTIAIVQYYTGRNSRNNAILMEITVSYIIAGNKILLDKFLGKLIAGTWRRHEYRPGNALFRILDEEISNGNFWKRRRISEALPMLYGIDEALTIDLIKKLRNDWSGRWKSDIRRRAVESLYNKVADSVVLIDDIKQKEILEILPLRKSDQIFTAFAVFEAISAWTKVKDEIREGLVADCLQFARTEYSDSENEAILWLKDFLIDGGNDRSQEEIFDVLLEAASSENELIRVAAARNILICSGRMPERTLSAIQELLADKSDEARNIRRPLAKERVVRYLIDNSVKGSNRERAKNILCSLLVDDPDDIIRVTAFDEIDYLIDRNPDYARDICGFVIESEDTEELKERARRVLADMDAESTS